MKLLIRTIHGEQEIPLNEAILLSVRIVIGGAVFDFSDGGADITEDVLQVRHYGRMGDQLSVVLEASNSFKVKPARS